MLFVSGIANAQIINFPDANFKNVLLSANASNQIAYGVSGYTNVDTNGDGEIQVSEASVITILQFQSASIVDLTGIENFTNLANLGCYSNTINNFNLNGLTNLQTINISGNYGTNTVFNFSNLPALTNLSFYYSNITSLTLTSLSNVINLNLWGNSNLSSLSVTGLTSLDRLSAWDCTLTNFSLINSPLLSELNLSNSHLNSITITSFPILKKLNLQNNNLTDTSAFSNLNNLEELNIQGNQIPNLVLPSLPALKYFYCGSNGFPTINLLGYPNLRGVAVNNNTISSLDFSNNPLLQQITMDNNPIYNADFSNLTQLSSLSCSGNFMSQLDLSNSPYLTSFNYFNNPNLTAINLKSGLANTINYNTSIYYNLPNLMHICVDDGDTFTYSLLSTIPTVPISSYCTFVPGGDYNTIAGAMIFDANNNGCDASDATQSNIRIDINDGSVQGATYTNSLGNYTFYTQSGSFDLTPNVENSSWFNFSPSSATIPFANNNNNTATQNFCIAANGVHNDLEVIIAPVIPAQPGFDTVYKVVYKNKGNQTLSGDVNFNYNDAVLDYISATVSPNTQTTGLLTWNYTNLLPFESRSFEVTLNVNSPVETPPVVIGDELSFSVTINPLSGDENVSDNQMEYHQIVIGSFDPNNITCIEGDVVSPSEIGNYLHYIINFENTGTTEADKIVVRTEIDPTKFDINSLQVLNTSHSTYIRQTGNVVEFIFQNIALETGGHGNVMLKIRSNNTLVTGDMVSKRADIFFDYNAPIDTGLANTTFQALKNAIFDVDNAISIYPNPTQDNVHISCSGVIKTIEMFDVEGRLLQTKFVDGSTTTVNISDKSNGVYFLKITSDKGSKVEKLVKN